MEVQSDLLPARQLATTSRLSVQVPVGVPSPQHLPPGESSRKKSGETQSCNPSPEALEKIHTGEVLALLSHPHPTAGRRTQLGWSQPTSTPKSSLPMPQVILSIRGGEQGRGNKGSGKIILSLLQHSIKAEQIHPICWSPFQRNEFRCLFCEMTSFRVQMQSCRVLIVSFYTVICLLSTSQWKQCKIFSTALTMFFPKRTCTANVTPHFKSACISQWRRQAGCLPS